MTLEIGKQYRIKTFKRRPNHWNERGDMDEYQGQEVTIQSFDSANPSYIYCKEITGYWFMPSDFELIEREWDD